MTEDPARAPLTAKELARQAEAKKLGNEQPLESWNVSTLDIPAKGFECARKASAQELARIAQLLGLVSMGSLEASYRIHGLAGGGWRLTGSIAAAIVQSCVVSLEPVPAQVEEEFAVEFWRDLDEPEGGEDKTVLGGTDVEALEGETIPVGRIVFETLSGALDPFPRKEGAAFQWQDEKAADAQNANPFSILARLKDKP